MRTSVELSGDAPASRNRRSVVTLVVTVAGGILLGALCALPFGRFALGIGLGAVGGVAISAALNRTRDRKPVKETGPGDLEALKAYTDGKMQRYKLLFGVNGGAFAVGQFVLGPGASKMEAILPIQYLADGAIIYTALMTVDIWLYGQMMREKFVGSDAFTVAGRALLLLVSVLLMGGWFLVSLMASRAAYPGLTPP